MVQLVTRSSLPGGYLPFTRPYVRPSIYTSRASQLSFDLPPPLTLDHSPSTTYLSLSSSHSLVITIINNGQRKYSAAPEYWGWSTGPLLPVVLHSALSSVLTTQIVDQAKNFLATEQGQNAAAKISECGEWN
jgi:hypothetical protein